MTIHTAPKPVSPGLAARSRLVRTNVTLPADLLKLVDEYAGPRGRSAYVAEALAYRVKRDRLKRAIEETAGSMVGKPGHMDADEVYRWVRSMREGDWDPWAEAKQRDDRQ
jgi:hypothetical protein